MHKTPDPSKGGRFWLKVGTRPRPIAGKGCISAADISPHARRPIDPADIRWAGGISVIETRHLHRLQKGVPGLLGYKQM